MTSISEISLTINASALSWYGAITGSFGLLLGILSYFRDRSMIIVKWKSGWRVITPNQLYQTNTDYIVIDVVNKGRRPATIDKVGYLSLHGKDAIATESLMKGSRKLQEGERTTYTIKQEHIDLGNVAYFYAQDQTGRLHKKRVAAFLDVAWSKILQFFRLYK